MDGGLQGVPFEHQRWDEEISYCCGGVSEDSCHEFTDSEYSSLPFEQTGAGSIFGPDINLNLQPQSSLDLGHTSINLESNQHLDGNEYVPQNRWNPERPSDQDFDWSSMSSAPREPSDEPVLDIPNQNSGPLNSSDFLSTTKDFLATFRELGSELADPMAADPPSLKPSPRPARRHDDTLTHPTEPKSRIQDVAAPYAHERPQEPPLSQPPRRRFGVLTSTSTEPEPRRRDVVQHPHHSPRLVDPHTLPRGPPRRPAELKTPICVKTSRMNESTKVEIGNDPSENITNTSEEDQPCELVLQPETRPISQEQLIAEVKGIYAGLVMVEAKCIEVDRKLKPAATEESSRLNNDQWQALIALHRTLLHEHHDFSFLLKDCTTHPSAKKLAAKYTSNFPEWRSAFDTILECFENKQRKTLNLEEALNLAYINLSFSKILWRFTHPNSRDNLAQKLQNQWCLSSGHLFNTSEENSVWKTLQDRWKTDILNLLKPHQVAPPNVQYVSLQSSWDIRYALEIPVLFFKVISRISGHIHIALEGLHRVANDTQVSPNPLNSTESSQPGTMWVLHFFGGLLSIAERLGFKHEVELAYIMVQQKWLQCREDVKEFLRRLTKSSKETQLNITEFHNHLDDERKSIKRRCSEDDGSGHDQQRPKFNHRHSDPGPVPPTGISQSNASGSGASKY
ncbi:hypothetical protein TWF696_004390 [Orbilia brochopaga]|uniref:Uncharacterized protein n=1 Tax=Orbilia brochopaga TaxID=3140254 RepID=A0AAV9V677_9PEZI